MRHFRSVILGFGLLVIAFLLVLPDVDPPEGAGAEATAVVCIKGYSAAGAAAVSHSDSIRPTLTSDVPAEPMPAAGLLHAHLRASLTLLCLLRC